MFTNPKLLFFPLMRHGTPGANMVKGDILRDRGISMALKDMKEPRVGVHVYPNLLFIQE